MTPTHGPDKRPLKPDRVKHWLERFAAEYEKAGVTATEGQKGAVRKYLCEALTDDETRHLTLGYIMGHGAPMRTRELSDAQWHALKRWIGATLISGPEDRASEFAPNVDWRQEIKWCSYYAAQYLTGKTTTPMPSTMLKAESGKTQRCDCGANVFTPMGGGVYRCNGCGTEYETERIDQPAPAPEGGDDKPLEPWRPGDPIGAAADPDIDDARFLRAPSIPPGAAFDFPGSMLDQALEEGGKVVETGPASAAPIPHPPVRHARRPGKFVFDPQ